MLVDGKGSATMLTSIQSAGVAPGVNLRITQAGKKTSLLIVVAVGCVKWTFYMLIIHSLKGGTERTHLVRKRILARHHYVLETLHCENEE